MKTTSFTDLNLSSDINDASLSTPPRHLLQTCSLSLHRYSAELTQATEKLIISSAIVIEPY
jgi:hypothetical protein